MKETIQQAAARTEASTTSCIPSSAIDGTIQPTVRQPAFEGDFALPVEFPLEAGGILCGASLHYALYGRINPARDNLVLVCHALSGSARIDQWWPATWSMPGLVDPDRDAVLGINILGSCYGSTGPASIDPATGQPYGPNFPLVGIGDIVRAEALLLDALHVPTIKLAIGPSIGGMQVLEWAIRYPSRLRKGIAVGAGPLGAMGLGLNHLQRQMIQLDPVWNGGRYLPDAPPVRGMALARGLAVCSYKSGALFHHRFERRPDRSGEDPWLDLPALPTLSASPHLAQPPTQPGMLGGRFDIAGYLDYQGEKFNQRFDANAYLVMTRIMDLFDPVRGYASPVDAWRRIEAELTLIGISSDWLFPPAQIQAMASSMQAAGVRCEYRELLSDHGHDAFLAEPQMLIDLLNS